MSKIVRQSLLNRIIHWGIAINVILLIITGIFQLPVAKRYGINEIFLMHWSGDYSFNLVLHYIASFFLIVLVFFHIVFHTARKEFDIFPKKGDLKQSFLIIKSMLLKQKEPPSAKYLAEQRIAYFVIGGILLLLIITGLLKSLKNLAGFNLGNEMYFYVATLHNIGLFLIILAIFGHLSAFIFKENRKLLSAMFSGKVDAKYVLHRHSLWSKGTKEAKKVLQKNIEKNPK